MQHRQYADHPDLPGMGFMFEEVVHRGHRMLVKYGDMPGMHAFMALLPQEGIGVHVVSNGDGTGGEGVNGLTLATKIVDRYLQPEEPPAQVPAALAGLGPYAGWYLGSRTSDHSVMKISALVAVPIQITAGTDGGLLISGLEEAPTDSVWLAEGCRPVD
ncbi:hypothetical protein [Nonomuraea sp. NPDC002799]